MLKPKRCAWERRARRGQNGTGAPPSRAPPTTRQWDQSLARGVSDLAIMILLMIVFATMKG
jgi:hypothetical protein